jgi:hypothetical protein
VIAFLFFFFFLFRSSNNKNNNKANNSHHRKRIMTVLGTVKTVVARAGPRLPKKTALTLVQLHLLSLVAVKVYLTIIFCIINIPSCFVLFSVSAYSMTQVDSHCCSTTVSTSTTPEYTAIKYFFFTSVNRTSKVHQSSGEDKGL